MMSAASLRAGIFFFFFISLPHPQCLKLSLAHVRCAQYICVEWLLIRCLEPVDV